MSLYTYTRRIWHAVTNAYQPPAITEGDLRDVRDTAYVRAFLRHHLTPDAVCLDVGAHRGAFLNLFAEFAPRGRHVAFEAIPALAVYLREHYPAVAVHHCALSDRDGQAEFHYVPELPGWSGLRPQPYPIMVRAQRIRVTLAKLDDLVSADVPVAFIKVDVEGAELEVLRGAERTLTQWHPPIYFECAKVHHAYYTTTPQAVHAFLTRCGYRIYLVDQSGPLTAIAFAAEYEHSFLTGYDRAAWGNYLALSFDYDSTVHAPTRQPIGQVKVSP